MKTMMMQRSNGGISENGLRIKRSPQR